MQKHPSIQEALHTLLEKAQGKPVFFSTVLEELKGRGYPALLVLIGLPFCLPIQIPGLSTPFGLFLAFIGLRIAFGKRVHLPNWLLSKQIPYDTLKKIVETMNKGLVWGRHLLRPRLVMLVQHSWLHCCHGLFVTMLSLILALPLPIPFTNLLTAIPIVLIGLSLLEDDGVVLILAYLLVLASLLIFFGLFYLGNATMHKVRV